MSASTQLARLLALVPYLLNHAEANVADVARDFGVTTTQLRKDLELLTWCGLPGQQYGTYIEIDMDAVDGQGVVRLDNAEYLSRPLRFTADEAVALVLALRSLSEVADPEQRSTIEATIAKLERAAAAEVAAADRTQVRISGGDEEVRRAVHRALRDGRRLHLTYDVAARAETTERQVDPLRASVRDGYAYLDAWCHRARGLRSFRMDRIVAAEVLDAAADPHPDLTLPDPVQGWFSGPDDGADPVVTLDLAPAAHWVVEYYPTLAADDLADDRTEIGDGAAAPTDGRLRRARFRVGDPAWLRGLLLRLGPDVRVVAPVGAGDAAADEAREAVEQYRALGLLDPADQGSG